MKALYFLLITLFLLSCDGVVDNDKLKNIDCNNLIVGLISKNSDIVNSEINKLVIDLVPSKTDSDTFGHKENMDLLIERLNLNCNNIEAQLLCYACIKTNPPQSEIRITTDSLGTPIERIVDILTPEDAILQSVSVHW